MANQKNLENDFCVCFIVPPQGLQNLKASRLERLGWGGGNCTDFFVRQFFVFLVTPPVLQPPRHPEPWSLKAFGRPAEPEGLGEVSRA